MTFNHKFDFLKISLAAKSFLLTRVSTPMDSRRFSSYIYKYDNVYGDREIRDYIRQRDNESYAQWQTRIVMESERIKKEILDFEIDMWGY